MKKLIFNLILILSFISCNFSPKLPETYGVYVFTNNEYKQLVSQKILFKGNLLFSVRGIKKPSGLIIEKIESFLVFQNGIDPNSFVLTKLKYKNYATVQGLFDKEVIPINFWVPDKSINLKVAPMPEIKDMYKLVPSETIEDGFYALHCGTLLGNETIDAFDKSAFDFIVGKDTIPYLRK